MGNEKLFAGFFWLIVVTAILIGLGWADTVMRIIGLIAVLWTLRHYAQRALKWWTQ